MSYTDEPEDGGALDLAAAEGGEAGTLAQRLKSIRNHFRGEPGDLLVLIMIMFRAGPGSGYRCWATSETLAEDTLFTDGHVRRARGRLIASGWLKLHQSGNGRKHSTVVSVVYPEGEGVPADAGAGVAADAGTIASRIHPARHAVAADAGRHAQGGTASGGAVPRSATASGDALHDHINRANTASKARRNRADTVCSSDTKELKRKNVKGGGVARERATPGEVATGVAAAAGPGGPSAPARRAGEGVAMGATASHDPGPGPDTQASGGAGRDSDAKPLGDAPWHEHPALRATLEDALESGKVGRATRAGDDRDMRRWIRTAEDLGAEDLPQAIDLLRRAVAMTERQSGQAVRFPREIPPSIIDHVRDKRRERLEARAAPTPAATEPAPIPAQPMPDYGPERERALAGPLGGLWRSIVAMVERIEPKKAAIWLAGLWPLARQGAALVLRAMNPLFKHSATKGPLAELLAMAWREMSADAAAVLRVLNLDESVEALT
jgi:hypothetical protein